MIVGSSNHKSGPAANRLWIVEGLELGRKQHREPPSLIVRGKVSKKNSARNSVLLKFRSSLELIFHVRFFITQLSDKEVDGDDTDKFQNRYT